MARFALEVVSRELTKVTDTETGKEYMCKNVWYHRNGDPKFYVNVANVAGKQMKDMFSFPWTGTIADDGKFEVNPIGLVHETDLAGKTSVAMPSLDMFR